MNKSHNLEKKGFTLIEIMLAVVIMGVLAAVAVPRFFEIIERTHRSIDASTALEIKNILVREFATETIQFTNATCGSDCGNSKEAEAQRLFVAVVVTKTGSKAMGGGAIVVIGKTWKDDKYAYERFEKVMKDNGFTNLEVQAKKVEDGGWSTYAVVLYADGSVKIASSDEETSIATAAGDLEGKISAMVAKSPTNIELFLDPKARN